MFWFVVLILLIISFLAALYSLRKEMNPPTEIRLTKKELMKEKVLFRRD